MSASNIQRKLDEKRRLLEIANDNIMILQNDLQKLTQLQSQLMSASQQEMRSLDPQESKARNDLQQAQAKFLQAQAVFKQHQDAMNKAQDEFNRLQDAHRKTRQQIIDKNGADIKSNASKVSQKEKEILTARTLLSRTEADIRDISKQLEYEQKMMVSKAANDNQRRNDLRK